MCVKKITGRYVYWSELGLSSKYEWVVRRSCDNAADVVLAARQNRLTEFKGVGPVRSAGITKELQASGFIFSESAVSAAYRRLLVAIGIDASPSENVAYESMKEITPDNIAYLRSLMEWSLTETERKAIDLGFGLNGEPPLGLEDIYRVINEDHYFSRNWIRGIQAKALRKMSHRCRQRYILQHFPECIRTPGQEAIKNALEDNYPVVSALFQKACADRTLHGTLDDMRMEELNLPLRIKERFWAERITTVGAILRLDELKLIRACGRCDFAKEVIDRLHQLDISLSANALPVAN